MRQANVKISKSAKGFIQQHHIEDVTFNLIEAHVVGGGIRYVREIEAVYKAPGNASGYRYCKIEGFHIFIARKIRLLGPLTVATEGIWKKRLCLLGANIPI